MTTWSSSTPSIQSEIQRILDDGTFETSGDMYDLLLPWTNRIVYEICNEVNIRDHLVSSGTVSVTTSDYEYDMPTTAGSVFMKKSERFTKVRVDDEYIEIVGIEELNAADPDHDETSTTIPTYVAIEGTRLFIYPMYTGTITIEEYYREPVDMSASTDVPDIPKDHLRTDLIVAGVVGKYGFPAINEHQKALAYYNRNTNPKSGMFFELLELYRKHHQSQDTVWKNRAKYY